jgi:hypothetical protein
VSGKPYAWVDEFTPSRRHTRRYTQHDPLLYPRFPDTDVPVPAEETPCVDKPEAWFPDHHAKKRDVEQAKNYCAFCWMKPECQAYGLAHPQLEGIWGGLDQRARARRTARR